MKRFEKIFLGLAVLVSLWAAPSAQAYSMNYGGAVDPTWAGVYNTMGYSGYGAMSGVYTSLAGLGYGASNSWYGSNWGGSCGTMMYSCSGGYDYANLYGAGYYGGNYSDYGYGSGYYDYNIHINYIVPYYVGGYSSCGTSACGTSTCNSGCSHSTSACGTCMWCGSNGGGSWYMPGYSYPPSYPGITYNPLNNNTGYPPDQVINIVTSPPVLPPWGGCGNVVSCPTGPVQPQTPTYTAGGTATGTTPVRYRIPRTAETH